MRIKGQKIPDSWVNCEECKRPYSFIRARVSYSDRDLCLECGAKFRSKRKDAPPITR